MAILARVRVFSTVTTPANLIAATLSAGIDGPLSGSEAQQKGGLIVQWQPKAIQTKQYPPKLRG